jgi:hypothetical protein
LEVSTSGDQCPNCLIIAAILALTVYEQDLWHLSASCEERISLHELRGQTLAVDLAGWVVQVGCKGILGLSHEMDLAFDDVWLILGLNKGQGHFF